MHKVCPSGYVVAARSPCGAGTCDIKRAHMSLNARAREAQHSQGALATLTINKTTGCGLQRQLSQPPCPSQNSCCEPGHGKSTEHKQCEPHTRPLNTMHSLRTCPLAPPPLRGEPVVLVPETTANKVGTAHHDTLAMHRGVAVATRRPSRNTKRFVKCVIELHVRPTKS